MSIGKVPRTGRPRAPAITRIVANTFEGTRELVEALVDDSRWHPPAWRPIRAAAARALGTRNAKGHVWMTAAEFVAWVSSYTPGKIGEPMRQVGIAFSRRKSILHGSSIHAIEALAIAHYRAGLPLPCDLEPEAFTSWFMPRFGAVERVAGILGVNPRTISDQLRGFAMTSAGRAERLPDITLVRALDWCWRVGPLSPYGERPGFPDFPGQMEGAPCGS